MKKNWEDKGDAFYVQGDLSSAIKMYTNALKSNPRNLTALKKKGEAEFQNKWYKDALNTHYLLLKVNRSNKMWEQEILTLHFIGKILIKLNDYAKAIEIYSELAELNIQGQNYEGLMENYAELASLNFEIGNYEEFLKFYDTLFDISGKFNISIPNEGVILYRLSKVLFLQNKIAKAFKYLEQSIKRLKEEVDNLPFDGEIEILHEAEQLREEYAKKLK